MKLIVSSSALLASAFGSLALLASAPADAAMPVDYGQSANWLCRPGRDDVCSRPLTSTIVSPADGSLTRKTYAPDPAAPIDCFYVYPTASHEPAANADMTNGPEEQHVAAVQFARFSAVCRPYAPLYRQATVSAMEGAARGDRQVAYEDVLAAWRDYLAHDNHGRGVVLIGHSQGSHHLARLISEEIDGKPVQRLLVSAVLAGGEVQSPAGGGPGGSFRHIGLCRSADETGCVIAYSSYLASDPPGPQSVFGHPHGPGLQDACVNPGELVDHGVLDAELPTTGRVAAMLGTPLVENPGLISAVCATAGDRTFLSVSVKSAGVGAVSLNRAFTDLDGRAPGWGLHAIDVNLALGDLVEIVSRQGKAWAAARR